MNQEKWDEHMNNDEVLMKIETKKIFMLSISKSQLKFLEHKMKKEILKNLTLIRHTEVKKVRREQKIYQIRACVNGWREQGLRVTYKKNIAKRYNVQEYLLAFYVLFSFRT